MSPNIQHVCSNAIRVLLKNPKHVKNGDIQRGHSITALGMEAPSKSGNRHQGCRDPKRSRFAEVTPGEVCRISCCRTSVAAGRSVENTIRDDMVCHEQVHSTINALSCDVATPCLRPCQLLGVRVSFELLRYTVRVLTVSSVPRV